MAGYNWEKVFPARAGMSPIAGVILAANAGFPRTRGDEPVAPRSYRAFPAFSPHARG